MVATAKTVLLVEDNDLVRALYARHLTESELAWNVMPVGRLDEALKVLGHLRPDVALVDLHLPNGTGLEMMRSLLAAGGDWPIVVTSGYYDDRWGAEVIRLSWRVESFIAKDRVNSHVLNMMLEHAVIRNSRNAQHFARIRHLEGQVDKLTSEQVASQVLQQAKPGRWSKKTRRAATVVTAAVLTAIAGVVQLWPSYAELAKPATLSTILLAVAGALVGKHFILGEK